MASEYFMWLVQTDVYKPDSIVKVLLLVVIILKCITFNYSDNSFNSYFVEFNKLLIIFFRFTL